MITRFKVLCIAAVFVISAVFLTIFFSDDGILADISTQKRIISIQEEVKEKESDLTALRYKAGAVTEEKTVEGDVIHSFTDDSIFDPSVSGAEREEESAYSGLSFFRILLYSLLITLVWSVIIVVVIPALKGMKKGGKKNGSDSQS